MTTFIYQDLIPEHLAHVPHRIRSRQLTWQGCKVVHDHILDNGPEVLGISLCLSTYGKVDAIAFATSSDVFYIDARAPCKGGHELEELLNNNSRCVLAGFGMARIALHLHRHCGVHVHGVDLSTLHALSTRSPQSPAELASVRIHDDVRKHPIHALWYHHKQQDVCLRAWLSAVYVI